MTAPNRGGNGGWVRVASEDDFRAMVVGRVLTAEDMVVVIRADGSMTGKIGTSGLRAVWQWVDGLFCRAAWLDGEDLGRDCEIIEIRGDVMRYSRDAGRGEPVELRIGAA